MTAAKRLLLFFFLLTLSATAFGASIAMPQYAAGPADKKIFPGEVLIYKIYYLGIPVGESRSEIEPDLADLDGRKAYHIHVTVRSYAAIDWIYKVRDEHHSYVDAETLQSLRYEKKISEGWRRIQETIVYDPQQGLAKYFDAKKNLTQEMKIPAGTQDQLSCGYWARTLEPAPNSSVFIPVNADKQNWQLEVKFGETSAMDIPHVGTFQAMRMEPLMEFQGIFMRRGKAEGWVSQDPRRIPLKMKVRIPVLGNVRAELTDYKPGKSL